MSVSGAMPVSPGSARRRVPVAALLCALSAAVWCLTGCSSTVGGQAHPAVPVEGGPAPTGPSGPTGPPAPSGTPAPATPSPGTTDRAPAGPVSDLLPPPSAFPPAFADSAAVLPYRSAVQASEDLSGVHRGARTAPVACAPSAQPPGADDLAVMTASGPSGHANMAVQLERVGGTLEEFRSTLEGCTDVESDEFGAVARVHRTLIDSTPVDGADGDAVITYRQSVRSGDGEVSLERRSVVRATQIGDVRITVTGMDQQGDPPAPEDLSSLLSAAIEAVRAG